jgi:hypothetical protein
MATVGAVTFQHLTKLNLLMWHVPNSTVWGSGIVGLQNLKGGVISFSKNQLYFVTITALHATCVSVLGIQFS